VTAEPARGRGPRADAARGRRDATSLRNRIAAAGSLVVFVALVLASLIVFAAARRNLHDRLDSSLIATASSAAKIIQPPGQEGSDQSRTSGVLDIDGSLVQVLPSPLHTGKAPLGAISDEDAAVIEGKAPAYFSTITYQDQPYRLYTSLYQGQAGILIRVAKTTSATTAVLRTLLLLLAALTLAGTLIAAAGMRLLAGRVLSPVARLTRTIEHVTDTGDLATRVEAAGRDEIGRLARAFTAMMSALDSSIQAQQRLVADASHELRTPLTSLTTNLELLAEPEGLTDPQAPVLLGAAREQSQQLRNLINDIVDLGRYGQTQPHTEDIRVDLLAREIIDRATRNTQAVRIALSVPDDGAGCLIHADPDAIARALGNLIDNAAKWSPPGGTIEVDIDTSPAGVLCAVTDHGPGIPAADLPFIFDRFYRSTTARSRPGSGLGLSIVRQIADTHGGTITARTDPDGTVLRLTLPRTPAGT
jgi:two-component system, OmpR family, sensor histidine kinase MprB